MKISAGLSRSRVGAKSIEIVQYIPFWRQCCHREARRRKRHQGTDDMGGLKFMFPPQTPERDSESLETILEVFGSVPQPQKLLQRFLKSLSRSTFFFSFEITRERIRKIP
jgi:hypothetical protein